MVREKVVRDKLVREKVVREKVVKQEDWCSYLCSVSHPQN